MPTGRACASVRARATRRSTATRIPTARAGAAARRGTRPRRKGGASAGRMLGRAAAKQGGANASEGGAVHHEIVHKPTGRKLGYGDVAEAAAALPVPPADQVKLKDPSAF